MNRRMLCFLVVCACASAWAQPLLPPGTMVNAADYKYDLSPGAIASVFGQDLAGGYAAAASVPLPAELAGTRVEATDGTRTVALPVYMVSPSQVNVQVPWDLGPRITVRVKGPHGETRPYTLALSERAPRLFTWNMAGTGTAIATRADGTPADQDHPVQPGEWITLWANGLGAVEPALPAGHPANDGSEGRPLHRVTGQTKVWIDGQPAEVLFAGLAPYNVGLYQINVRVPYSDRRGQVQIALEVDDSVAQGGLTMPLRPNGFYWALSAGKFPNGQTRTAAGPDAAVAFLHDDLEAWGPEGFRRWSSHSELGGAYAAAAGLALTLRHAGAMVYDNNGIDDGGHQGFYGVPDGQPAEAGRAKWLSQSTNYRVVHATHFRLTSPAVIDEIVSYFDANGDSGLPFDPNNVYNGFRMNIWSDGPGGVPAADTFTGDVFSSETADGRFEVSPAAAVRVFPDGAADAIGRLAFRLAAPVTLPAGDYWFASDVAVPEPIRPAAGVLHLSGNHAERAIPGQRVSLEP